MALSDQMYIKMYIKSTLSIHLVYISVHYEYIISTL